MLLPGRPALAPARCLGGALHAGSAPLLCVLLLISAILSRLPTLGCPPHSSPPPQVRTLQLEMEYVCGALEDEARDIIGGAKGTSPEELQLALGRRGSSDEVALLVAGGCPLPSCAAYCMPRASRACCLFLAHGAAHP